MSKRTNLSEERCPTLHERQSPGAPQRQAYPDIASRGTALLAGRHKHATGPADKVKAFEGKPIGVWFVSQGEHSLIQPDGSYATVYPDDEDTGFWFTDVVLADGSLADGPAQDSSEVARSGAEEMLRRAADRPDP